MLGGRTSTAERTVIVEEKSNVEITYNDETLGDYIALSLGAEEDYKALDLGAFATNITDYTDVDVKVTWSKTFDINTPGFTTITYYAEIKQGSHISYDKRTRIIEVVDPIKEITINVPSSVMLSDARIDEGDEIDLTGVTVDLIKTYNNGENSKLDVKLEELSIGYTEETNPFKVVVAPFTGTKAEYNEEDDSANANQDLYLSVTWTNPADKTATPVNETEYLGTATVIGKIRKIEVDETSVKVAGDIYTPIEVAKVYTPTYQDDFTDDNIKVRCKTGSGNVDKDVKDRICYDNILGRI
ncbi:MAG: hypothetical protein K2H53_04545 [Clostridia bacterium]|nr:hypothetical protein [Clostridia bacterium]